MPSNNIIMRFSIIGCILLAACSSDSASESPDAGSPSDASSTACVPPTGGSALTYTQLFTTYFAPGTPGHCANAACHGNPGNTWTCGTTKDTCYAGMVGVGLINTTNPKASLIANTSSSPIRWVNSNPSTGIMPADSTAANNAGRDAIIAWVNACAQNN